MKKLTDLDYVEQYASKMKGDNRIFRQQSRLIECQMRSSSSMFRNMFKGIDFKTGAREYLRKIGLLKD